MGNILVTGGSGLIGWCVSARLLAEGHRVIIYDLRPDAVNIAAIGHDVLCVAGDICDLPRILSVMKRQAIDHVVHLASFIADQSATDPGGAFRINVGGFANILDAAVELNVKRIVWTSSITAFAVSPDYANQAIDEAHQLAGTGPYGVSKFACEAMARAYRQATGLEVVAIRPALTYGIGRLTGAAGMFNAAIRAMAMGEPAAILASESLHQPMFNHDMAELICAALFAPDGSHPVFNAPVERNYDDADLMAVLRQECPDAHITLQPAPPYVPRVPVMDGTLAKSVLGFTPRTSLASGIRQMIAYFRAVEG